MDEGERYTMRIHRTTEQGNYTAEAETYTGPVWQVTAVAEGSDDEIIVGEIFFEEVANYHFILASSAPYWQEKVGRYVVSK
jgi:hypothetical protein